MSLSAGGPGLSERERVARAWRRLARLIWIHLPVWRCGSCGRWGIIRAVLTVEARKARPLDMLLCDACMVPALEVFVSTARENGR